MKNKLILLLSFMGCAFANPVFSEVVYSLPLDAKEIPIGHVLEWQTVSEINVSTFVVEKSTDGVNYFELGSLSGSSFSMVDKNYHFMDVGATEAKIFYRLREETTDGTIGYTLPTLVEKKMVNNINIVTMSSVNSKSKFKITADIIKEATIACSVTGESGKTLQSFDFQTINGLNDIEVNLESLPVGTYFVQLKLDGEVEKITIRKVNDPRAARPQVATTKKPVSGRQ